MLRLIIGIACGLIIGGLIGHFGKCATGTCPLTSNPYIGAIWGGFLGAILTWPK